MKKILLIISTIFLTISFSFAQSNDIPCVRINLILSVGARDTSTSVPPNQVTLLQNFLKSYFKLSDADFIVSGYYGKLTKKYLQNFQKEQGITQTGLTGIQTRNKLLSLCADKPQTNVTSTSTVTTSSSTPPIIDPTKVPSVDITPASSTIALGAKQTLKVTSNLVVSCYITGDKYFRDRFPLNGTFDVSPHDTAFYGVKCITRDGKSIEKSVVINVSGVDPSYVDPSSTATSSSSPVLVVSVSSSTVASGQSSTVTVTSSGMKSCTYSSKDFSGLSFPWNTTYSFTVAPTATITYTFNCVTNSGSNTSQTGTINVGATNGPKFIYNGGVGLQLWPKEYFGTTRQPANLTYQSVNAGYCTIAGGGYKGETLLDLSGYFGVYPSATTVYTITCYGKNGVVSSVSDTATVTFGNPPPPTATMNVGPVTYLGDGTANIYYKSSNAIYCTIDGGIYTKDALLETTGYFNVFPTQTTTYTIECGGNYGTDSKQITVTGSGSNPPFCRGVAAGIACTR